jgi:hypothetical protein
MRTVRRGIVRWIVTPPIETPLGNNQAAGQTRAGPYSAAEDLLIWKNSLGKSKGKLQPGARDYDYAARQETDVTRVRLPLRGCLDSGRPGMIQVTGRGGA